MNDLPKETSEKNVRLRAAYDAFQRKMLGLREERLEFIKIKFQELDERKIAQVIKEL